MINFIGYVIMGVDKKRAIRGAWRISEASLFTVALLGGALGCTLGILSTGCLPSSYYRSVCWYFSAEHCSRHDEKSMRSFSLFAVR